MLLFTKILFLFVLPLLAQCAEDFYKLLGVSKNAGDKELKKAYRNLSKKFHPDKNPEESARQKFVEVGEAYETLSDPELRKIYDQYGKEGLENHKRTGGRSHGGHDPFDLFSRFFGGGGHFGGERRGPNMEARLAVSLRDFYTGTQTQFTIQKQAICDKCEGSGSEDGKKHNCRECGGRGIVVQKLQLAPGIFQQVQGQCGHCGGAGKVISHPCKTCGGRRVMRSEETHTLHVEPGMPIGTRITYENEADESPDHVAGDLIVILLEAEQAIQPSESDRTDGTFFRRKGNDLYWREVLSLREAWMGDWTRNLTHLDGHTVQLSRPRGAVVQPNMVEALDGEGMPIYDAELGGANGHGKLLVEYVVVLPDQMDKNMEQDFWGTFDKWRKKIGVDLHKDSGRPRRRDEL